MLEYVRNYHKNAHRKFRLHLIAVIVLEMIYLSKMNFADKTYNLPIEKYEFQLKLNFLRINLGAGGVRSGENEKPNMPRCRV